MRDLPSAPWAAGIRRILLRPPALTSLRCWVAAILLVAAGHTPAVHAQLNQPIRPSVEHDRRADVVDRRERGDRGERRATNGRREDRRAQRQPSLEDSTLEGAAGPVPGGLTNYVGDALSPSGLTSTIKVLLLLTILSLAPSILIMTTCFIRFVIILGLLRQAMGTNQLPPTQIVVSLCLFLTFLVMAPIWNEAYTTGVLPYTEGQHQDWQRAMTDVMRPIRRFMGEQIEFAENSDGVLMLAQHQAARSGGEITEVPETYEEIPLSVLLPAFMLSELKQAFIIGFQLYLPFVVIDMVISSVLISMGMMMLPPVLISLPFKLLLFVMVDGWYLTVDMMLRSVGPAP